MDRMSPLDATFLHVENAANPMHIGSVTVYDGPAPAYGDVIRMVSGKLPLLPRYRQIPRFVPMGLGRPVWVDDAHFQILYHVRHTAVPAPGGREELRNLAGRIFAQLLDRSKPLWELWLVEGLEEGRWALISKIHHCMVDGVAGTEILSVLLDQDPDAGLPPPPPPWSAPAAPSGVHLLADAAADAIRAPLTRLRGLPALARTPFSGGVGPGTALRLLASLSHWRQHSAGSLNGPIGPHRRWSWAEADLADVKVIRAALGGTVNDVVLAAITHGFRDLLISRGEPVEDRVVRTLVPVSMRTDAERGTYNNRVSGVFPGLPVGIADPAGRLAAIHKQMDGLKRSGQAVAGDTLTRMSGFAPPMLLSVGARLGVRLHQRLVQTVTTNVPGPRFPLYALGRQMRYAYPYVPVGGTVRIGVAIFSYEGRLCFGITGDYDSVPDIDVLRAGIESGMTALLDAAGAVPARAARAVESNGHVAPRRTPRRTPAGYRA